MFQPFSTSQESRRGQLPRRFLLGQMLLRRNSTSQGSGSLVARSLLAASVILSPSIGCHHARKNGYRDLASTVGNDTACIDAIMCNVDAGAPPENFSEYASPPKTLRNVDWDNQTYRELTLGESVEIALTHSQVLRDLGARVLRNPDATASRENRALAETNPPNWR